MTQVEAAMLAAVEKALMQYADKIGKQAPVKASDRFARKDKAILRGFAKKGIKNAVLMDRTDPTKDFNVRPFGKVAEDGKKSGWLAVGRIVKKGEHGVRGLFHVSQTEEIKA